MIVLGLRMPLVPLPAHSGRRCGVPQRSAGVLAMDVWAISDLHLSLARPEGRERFAGRWREHVDQIERQWRAAVKPGDVVLLPGDLSMARNHRDLQPDLAWLDRLPGTKVLAPGNHDRWWNGVDRIRPMLRRTLAAVGGDAIALRGLVVCGSLSVPADDPDPAAALAELDRALEHARSLRDAGQPLFVLWHFPPFDQHGRPGPCVERLEAAGVSACVYGHLHSLGQWSMAVQGAVHGVRYHLVAADAIGFRPLGIATIADPSR
jgi:predicted phosphohydrolase